jgi:predicted TIM-barrel fold metal-dependent hydrolase
MQRIDAHQHLWDLAQFPCGWCGGIPVLNRNFSLADYQAAAAGADIVRTVFVECDVDEPHGLAEAAYYNALAREHSLIGGIVAAARPERADFPHQLDQLLALEKLRGLRRVLHVVPDAVSQAPLFAENLRLLARHQLTFDLCLLGRQLALARPLIETCPQVQFVLDHCGVPDIQGRAFEPWQAHIREIAACPNVVCKVSGIVVRAGAGWTVADLRPWLDHVIACFGWDRLLWGGDWPVCLLTATLGQWVAAADELVASATPAERQQFFYGNARRIYRL